MKRKKIFLNECHTKYCIVKLFKTKLEMQKYYSKLMPNEKDHNEIDGIHFGYVYVLKVDAVTGEQEKTDQIGMILLNEEECGAGVVCHEFGHAVLWAHRHSSRSRKRNPFPLVINSIEEEDNILYNLTYAVIQFYNWFYKVVEIEEPKIKNPA